MSEAPRNPELASVERALGRLSPAADGLSRDQLMFHAGQASVRRVGAWWPAATGVFSLALAVGAVALLLRPEPQTVVHVVYVTVPQAAPAPPESAEPAAPRVAGPVPTIARDVRPDEPTYLHLRDRVLRWGVDALPELPPSGPALPDAILDLSPRSMNQAGDPRWQAP